jgi:hypothetical protein
LCQARSIVTASLPDYGAGAVAELAHNDHIVIAILHEHYAI